MNDTIMRQTEIQIADIAIKLQAYIGTNSFIFKHYETGSYVELKVHGRIKLHNFMPIIEKQDVSIFAEDNDTIIRIEEPYTE